MPRRVSGRGYKHAAPPPLSHLTNTLPPTHPQAIQQSTPDYIITVTNSSYFSKHVLASNVLYVVLDVYFFAHRFKFTKEVHILYMKYFSHI